MDLGFPGDTSGKEPACQCRRHKRHRFDPGLGRYPGGEHGNDSGILAWRIPMDRGAWQAVIHGVSKSWT